MRSNSSISTVSMHSVSIRIRGEPQPAARKEQAAQGTADMAAYGRHGLPGAKRGFFTVRRTVMPRP